MTDCAAMSMSWSSGPFAFSNGAPRRRPWGDARASSFTQWRTVGAVRPSFRQIFEMEASYVWRTLRRLGVQERDLEDMVQSVFITVHRRLDSFEPERPLRPWLFGISLRVAMRYRDLARHRREVAGDGLEAIDTSPRADEQLERRQAQALVAEALEALDLDRRALFVMHEIDEMAMPEIAEVLDLPLNTAYSRLRRARELFAAAVKRLRIRERMA